MFSALLLIAAIVATALFAGIILGVLQAVTTKPAELTTERAEVYHNLMVRHARNVHASR